MALTIILSCIAILLGTAPAAVAAGRSHVAIRTVYGVCFAVSLILFAVSFGELIHVRATPLTVTLPLGLPWLGTHFRIDALAAFFLTVVNLGRRRRQPVCGGLRYARERADARGAVLSGVPAPA